MRQLIDSVSRGVPAALTEVITLGRTLPKRAGDIVAFFDRPGTSNGPTEAIHGRLEHLRGTALVFPNLTNSIARSLLETADSDSNYTLVCEEPVRGPREASSSGCISVELHTWGPSSPKLRCGDCSVVPPAGHGSPGGMVVTGP